MEKFNLEENQKKCKALTDEFLNRINPKTFYEVASVLSIHNDNTDTGFINRIANLEHLRSK